MEEDGTIDNACFPAEALTGEDDHGTGPYRRANGILRVLCGDGAQSMHLLDDLVNRQ